MIVGDRRIGEPIKSGELLNIVPDCLVVRMEDMSPIDMDINTIHDFSVHIPSDIRPLVNHKD